MPGPPGPGGRLDLNRPTYPLAAAIRLLEHGAHLVLVARWGETKRDGTQSKRPLWRKYLRRPASLMQVKDHITGGGLLGIVPASLGPAVLDVDQDDPTPLICDFLPWFAARSQQEGRMHLWYRDDARHRRGGVWRSDNGCGGELVASTGYVVLWGNALEDLAETLAYGDRPGQAPFAAVASALTWRDMSPPEPADTKAPTPKPMPKPTPKPVPAPAAQRRSVAAAPDLSETWPGLRNISLFDEVRLWDSRAYRSFSRYEDFAEAALQRDLAGRERMPVLDDFEDSEATTVARSVSVWTWTIKPTPGKRNGKDKNSGQQEYSPRSPATGEQQYHGDPALNADSEIQRYRRGCRTQLDAIRVEHRQTCVANRYVLGTPVAKLAITFGVTRRTVERDLSTAQMPTRRQARRKLQAQDDKRRRHKRRADQATSGTGTNTGQGTTARHSSATHNTLDREQHENRTIQVPEHFRKGRAQAPPPNLWVSVAYPASPLPRPAGRVGWAQGRARNRPSRRP